MSRNFITNRSSAGKTSVLLSTKQIFIISAVLMTEYNRIINFKEPINDKVLPGHVIRTEMVPNEGSCRVKCFLEPNCVSINVGPEVEGTRTCELKNFTDESETQTGLEEKKGYIHFAVEVRHFAVIKDEENELSWPFSKCLYSECVICITVTFIYINTYFSCRLYMRNGLSNAVSLTFM